MNSGDERRKALRAKDLWDHFVRPAPCRFDRYLKHAEGDQVRALAFYAWNISLCTHLLPVFTDVEVLLRNGIHNAMKRHYRTARWWDDSRVRMRRNQVLQLDSAVEDLRLLGIDEPTADDLVGALSFGFWTSLLGHKYESTVYSHFAQDGMPHIPADRKDRTSVESTFESIRLLRNKAFHNKAIYADKGELARMYELSLEAIGWLSPRHLKFVRGTCLFQQVLNQDIDLYVKQVSAVFRDDLA